MRKLIRRALALVLLAAVASIVVLISQYDPGSSGGRFLAPELMIKQQPAAAGTTSTSGEAPIQLTADPATATLAARYQPTVVVSAVDRFWPVSMLAALREIGRASCRERV